MEVQTNVGIRYSKQIKKNYKEIIMRKAIALIVSVIIVLSITSVSLAATNGYTHSYSNHRERASVSVETKPIGGTWFVGVELWNATGRFPDYDDISRGLFTSFSSKTHSADTGTYNGATRGYYVTEAKDEYGTPIPNTYGADFDY